MTPMCRAAVVLPRP